MNIMDYLTWRDDLPLEHAPFCPPDALALSILCYLDIGAAASGSSWVALKDLPADSIRNITNSNAFEKRMELLRKMQSSRRYADLVLHHYVNLVDAEQEMQFSAVCVDLPGNITCVLYRGTDNTLIGWREDFNMSCETPVPAQLAACIYLERIAGMRGCELWLMGHSKGGNLAVYAAAHASNGVRERCSSIYSFDGPGVDMATWQSAAYEDIISRTKSFVPQTSIIGMLLGYHRDYTVVHSDASGLYQHDPFTWQVAGPDRFQKEEKVNRSSELINETLHEWLAQMSTGQRAKFVEALFSLLEQTQATTMSQITGENKLKLTKTLINATMDMDPETRKVFLKLLGQFVTTGALNVVEMLTQKDEQETEKKEIGTPED